MQFENFSKESLAFLQSIRENNNKEWFEAHREEYETLIKTPCENFVKEMGEHLQVLVPTIKAIPKVNKSLFRIYRDIRFSKDKTPIKSRIGIIFWQGNGKRMQSASFYLHFSPDELFFATGIRGFSKETRTAYRDYIKEDNHREALHKILENIKAKGYEIPKPKYKRLPKEFDEGMSHKSLALFDAMYAYKVTTPEIILDMEGFIDYAFKVYEDLFELQQWIYELTLTVDNN